ncbi:MAG: tRNA (N(6)-L-threonylcarbamoyladenosine(37)-C(2))-methylthiotransferase MtaB [Clostridiales bacterium]|nr:tRNA (N(6)-L-threonylcarbamoyladenosine(37)-C(2))-methylthiotransferase MtaB [Clostridiales bacterium]
MKVSFYTLGCKVNQYDSQAMLEAFAAEGYDFVPVGETADIYIVNSCTVTAESDRKTRQAVRRFKKQSPDSLVILTGCMPQAYPESSASLPQADIIMGNRNYDDLFELIEEYFVFGQGRTLISPHKSGDLFGDTAIKGFNQRSRAVLKIEDGCDRFCSYCIIPYARGRVRSKPLEKLKAEMSSLASAGFSELVLVGINLSAYGSDLGASLYEAVEAACAFDAIKRVRLGSLEPQAMTARLISKLAGLTKLCPHFHLSLQSGCNKTLKNMNRGYTTREYEEICKSLRSSFEDCTITTDVMVGFPGESEFDFQESLNFVRHMAFEKVHVFPYSPRPGTAAAKMKERLTKVQKEERSQKMAAAAKDIRSAFLESQLGRTLEILVEGEDRQGYAQGFSANYTPVKIRDGHPEAGSFCKVFIEESDADFCYGSPVE